MLTDCKEYFLKSLRHANEVLLDIEILADRLGDKRLWGALRDIRLKITCEAEAIKEKDNA